MVITRRRALALGAAGGMSALTTRAFAQATEITVGTWGGDYAELLDSQVDEPLMKPLGIEVTQEIGSNDTRRMKLLAEKGARRSGMDVVCINDVDSFMLNQQGLLEAVPPDAVPRLSAVIPALRETYSIPHIYTELVVVYNPDKVKPAPVSYGDLFDPRFKGKVGFSDTPYIFNVAAANIAAGGRPDDMGPGRKLLLDLKKSEPKTFPTNEALSAAFRTEDIHISLMWMARCFMWRRAGVPVAWAVPEEGALPLVFEAAVPKNSGAKEGAWKYLNAMLNAKAQVAFSERMGYLPTVRDAVLPEELSKEIALSEAQQARLRSLDYEYVQRERGGILDFWNKEFKA